MIINQVEYLSLAVDECNEESKDANEHAPLHLERATSEQSETRKTSGESRDPVITKQDFFATAKAEGDMQSTRSTRLTADQAVSKSQIQLKCSSYLDSLRKLRVARNDNKPTCAFCDTHTKRLNEHVRRKFARFPVNFRFRLTKHLKDEVVANCDRCPKDLFGSPKKKSTIWCHNL